MSQRPPHNLPLSDVNNLWYTGSYSCRQQWRNEGHLWTCGSINTTSQSIRHPYMYSYTLWNAPDIPHFQNAIFTSAKAKAMQSHVVCLPLCHSACLCAETHRPTYYISTLTAEKWRTVAAISTQPTFFKKTLHWKNLVPCIHKRNLVLIPVTSFNWQIPASVFMVIAWSWLTHVSDLMSTNIFSLNMSGS